MNNKKIILPVCEPILSTYNYQMTQSVVAMQNPELYYWFLNQAVDLQCRNIFLRENKVITVVFRLFNNISVMPHIERLTVNTRFAGKNVHSLIKEMLNDGYYAEFSHVDDYYMQGKTFYKDRHFLHDGLIFGYDAETSNGKEAIYKVMAYDKNWRPGMFDMPCKCLDEAIASAAEQGIYSNITAMKAKPIKSKLHVGGIYTNIKNYLKSNLEIYPPNEGDNVYGTVVHDYIGMYMDKLRTGFIPYEERDRRTLRVIWEHKKLMTARIKAVEEFFNNANLTIWGTDLSKRYQKAVEEESDKLRLLYMKYNIKRDDELLPVIAEKLAKLKCEEEALLKELILKLENSRGW